jgi:peptide deformylase
MSGISFVGASSSANRLTQPLASTRRESTNCPLRHLSSGFSVRRRRTRCISASRVRMTGAETDVQFAKARDIEEVDPGAVEGTSLRVLTYPHPLLRAPNAEVAPEELQTEIKRVAKEMLAVMYASSGVGLAAPQVGINKRLMVFNPEGDSKAWIQEVVLVNPRVVGSSKGSDVEMEGCLSFPGMKGHVRRHEWVKVEAMRLNGKKFKIKYEGWTARIFQHEYDHLDGVLYVDRLEKEDEEKVQPQLKELIELYRCSPYEGLDPAI